MTDTLGVLSLAQIVTDPDQVRQTFDEKSLEELAASIKANGVIQPLLVRPLPGGTPNRFQLVAGERRLRAAKRAGLATVPVIVRPLEDEQVARVQIVENTDREALRPMELARAYAQFLADTGKSQAELARAIGKSEPHVTHILGLLKLPAKVQKQLDAGALDFSRARELVRVADDPELLEEALTIADPRNGYTREELADSIDLLISEKRQAAAARDAAAKAKLEADAKAKAKRERLRNDKKAQAAAAKQRELEARAAERRKAQEAKDRATREREAKLDDLILQIIPTRGKVWAAEVAKLAKQIRFPRALEQWLLKSRLPDWTPLDGDLFQFGVPFGKVTQYSSQIFEAMLPHLPGRWGKKAGSGWPEDGTAVRTSIVILYWFATQTGGLDRELARAAAKQLDAAARAAKPASPGKARPK